MRSIDWNVTARTGTPYIKSFIEERELTVMLAVGRERFWGLRHEEPFQEGIGRGVGCGNVICRHNQQRQGRFASSSPTGVESLVPPRKGRSHVLRMVRDLLVFQPEGTGTDIRLALDTVHQMLKRRSIVFLVSDFLANPESYRQAMLVTKRHHDVVAFDLGDPLEHEIPDVGVLALEDAESGRLRWVDTGSREWKREFAESVARLEEGKREVFTAAGVDRICVTTERDYVVEVGAFFKDRLRRLGR